MRNKILALVEDLLLSVQIQDTAGKLGYVTTVVQRESEFTEQLVGLPDLVLVDTSVRGVDWIKLVQAAKREQRKVVAFGQHTDLDARERALAAGADAMVANSAIATDMPRLLEKHMWN